MRLFQTNREKSLMRKRFKRFTVPAKLSRPRPSNEIKARPESGPTKKECRSDPGKQKNFKPKSGQARMEINEKSVSGQGSGPGPASLSLILEWLRFGRN